MRIKKNHLYLGVIIILIITGFFVFLMINNDDKNDEPLKAVAQENADKYVREDGLLLKPSVGKVDFEVTEVEERDSVVVSKVVYRSTGHDVFGFLVEPSLSGRYPGIVLLPGAGVGKDAELPLAIQVAQQGYVVFTIDQFGTGESKGQMLPFRQDVEMFKSSGLGMQHTLIIDALIAKNVVSQSAKVDENNIIFMGESLGGRIAMIAAALEDSIRGVIAISAAGYHYNGTLDLQGRYITSLDADAYINKISPRPVIMVHNTFDTNIPLQSAVVTYQKAEQPKAFFVFNDSSCNHGYCESMFTLLNESIGLMTGKKQ